jgi:hypothetical protein
MLLQKVVYIIALAGGHLEITYRIGRLGVVGSGIDFNFVAASGKK